MKNHLMRNAGWAAYSSRVAMLLSFVAIIMFLLFDRSTLPSGNANQQTLASASSSIFQGLSALLMIPVALALNRMVNVREATGLRLALIIGIVAMVVMFAFTLLVAFNAMPETQAGAPISLAHRRQLFHARARVTHASRLARHHHRPWLYGVDRAVLDVGCSERGIA